jgi:hypothetical protein
MIRVDFGPISETVYIDIILNTSSQKIVDVKIQPLIAII